MFIVKILSRMVAGSSSHLSDNRAQTNHRRIEGSGVLPYRKGNKRRQMRRRIQDPFCRKKRLGGSDATSWPYARRPCGRSRGGRGGKKKRHLGETNGVTPGRVFQVNCAISARWAKRKRRQASGAIRFDQSP